MTHQQEHIYTTDRFLMLIINIHVYYLLGLGIKYLINISAAICTETTSVRKVKGQLYIKIGLVKC